MQKTTLIIDSPVRESSLIYKTGYYCIDPIIFLEDNGKKIGYFPSTEYEKAKKNSTLDEIINLNEELDKIKGKYPYLKSSVIIDRIRENNRTIFVSPNFPVNEYYNLTEYGIEVVIGSNLFSKDRIIKTPDEVKKMQEVSTKNVGVMNSVKNILAESGITNDKRVKYHGDILTSEFLQNHILKQFIDMGLYAENVIVSIGNQGCDPHEYGHGDIYANTSIIVDIYPRDRNNYYYSDMTRTFCKGKASDDLKNIYAAVYEAQKIGLSGAIDGADSGVLHNKIVDYFKGKGFKTGIINGVLQGFMHGTGHGVGLDCHEPPFISNSQYILKNNMAVTVEPGLYYIDKGSVRIEDLVIVQDKEPLILTKYEKILEIG